MATTYTTDCPRCVNGTGRISAFSHVKGGICFKCGGRGKITLKRKPRPSMRFVAMQDFGDGRGFVMTFFFKARSQAEADRKLSAKLEGKGRPYYAQQIDEAAR